MRNGGELSDLEYSDVLALAQSQKPGQKKLSQAGPNHLAFVGFWPGLHVFKAQAGA